ncbi:peptidase C69 [Leptospira perolatii]|uniref:Peptidase C69 n=1 Tax=Leptospira perolatii TaxID=2023191 RepID=A0A2M9ZJP6_9LEPT|nr:TldD/PmbA family protein [Leptospira perolatii]PJZ69453.1 peptidase C69 [Leptospira perolatii]PJZ72278.1 peptidase C69 [Leptospira perolatii]
MDQRKAEKLIEAGKSRRADFVEIYEEESRNSSISLRDRKIEQAVAATDYGIGIRLIYGTDVLYAYTSNDDTDHLLSLIDLLADSRGESKSVPNSKFLLTNFVGETRFSPQIVDPRTIAPNVKLDLLQSCDSIARKVSSKIAQVGASASDIVTNIMIANSDGVWAEDLRVRSRFYLSVTAEKNGERFVASESPGAAKGYEFFHQLGSAELASRAADRALFMLDAGYIEGKKMPVVMGNGFGGVIFHEACGHPLETEAIRRNSSPFVGKLGEKIAHSNLTAYDDGTIESQYGTLAIDDEGSPTQRTLLIENGILKSYLSDRVGSIETGAPKTGSARRESYQYAPVARMRNTFIAAGKDSLEDMFASAGNGLYAKRMSGGSVNPATGEFNFAVEEGYVIRNGKLAEPVRGATLIGKGHEILPLISMVGSDLELAAGVCGAGSGSIPVTVGQPSIKVDEILVGGR